MQWRKRFNEKSAKAWSDFLMILSANPAAVDHFVAQLDRTGLDPTLPSAIRAQTEWADGDFESPLARLLRTIERRPLGGYESLIVGLILITLKRHEHAQPFLAVAAEEGVEDARLRALTSSAETVELGFRFSTRVERHPLV